MTRLFSHVLVKRSLLAITFILSFIVINSVGADATSDGGNSIFGVVKPPGAFNKAAPANSSTNQSTEVLLMWGKSEGASSYEYCIDTTADQNCDAEWVDVGSTGSISPPGLSPSTNYGWQIRARNDGGTTEANTGSFWRFATAPAPGSFSKSTPADSSVDIPKDTDWSWLESAGALSYEFCFDGSDNDDCNSGWRDAGTDTTTNLGAPLTPGITYFWQARAINAGGNTEANGGTWWSFTTNVLPNDFNKAIPANGLTGLPASFSLFWTLSHGAPGYEYCVDTTDNDSCDNSWTDVGNAVKADISDLAPGTTFYWQVQAKNEDGTTGANGGTWWSFTTANLPGEFSKEVPAENAVDVPKDTDWTWLESTLADGYEFCFDGSDNDDCNSGWRDAGTDTTTNLGAPLTPGITYFWQARAINADGVTEANSGTWWSFTTNVLPNDFGKAVPLNGSTGLPASFSLFWALSHGAPGYEYCVDTTDNDGCDNSWTDVGNAVKADISDLALGTTFYWQVRAKNEDGTTEANEGSWWSFSTIDPVDNIFADGFESISD